MMAHDLEANKDTPESLFAERDLSGQFEGAAGEVLSNQAEALYFFGVVEKLKSRGLIDDEFFDHLARARPRRKKEIDKHRQLWPRGEQVEGS